MQIYRMKPRGARRGPQMMPQISRNAAVPVPACCAPPRLATQLTAQQSGCGDKSCLTMMTDTMFSMFRVFELGIAFGLGFWAALNSTLLLVLVGGVTSIYLGRCSIIVLLRPGTEGHSGADLITHTVIRALGAPVPATPPSLNVNFCFSSKFRPCETASWPSLGAHDRPFCFDVAYLGNKLYAVNRPQMQAVNHAQSEHGSLLDNLMNFPVLRSFGANT